MANERLGAAAKKVLEGRGGRELIAGQYGRVWLDCTCVKEYDKLYSGKSELHVRQQRQLTRFFEIFCNNGQKDLNDEKFKREGAFPDGLGTNISIFEFKPLKWRLYGIVEDVDGIPTFIGLGVDPAKKQDKADQSLLRRVGKMAGVLLSALREKKDGSAGEAKQGSNRGRRGSRH